MSEQNVMDKPWVCFTCFAKLRFGDLFARGANLECPRCTSTDLHPADKGTKELDEYVGKIGTVQ